MDLKPVTLEGVAMARLTRVGPNCSLMRLWSIPLASIAISFQ